MASSGFVGDDKPPACRTLILCDIHIRHLQNFIVDENQFWEDKLWCYLRDVEELISCDLHPGLWYGLKRFGCCILVSAEFCCLEKMTTCLHLQNRSGRPSGWSLMTWVSVSKLSSGYPGAWANPHRWHENSIPIESFSVPQLEPCTLIYLYLVNVRPRLRTGQSLRYSGSRLIAFHLESTFKL